MAKPKRRRGIEAAVTKAGSPIALAAKIGVSVATVYNWLRTGGVPYTAWAIRVATATGVPLVDLVPLGPPPQRWRGRRGR